MPVFKEMYNRPMAAALSAGLLVPDVAHTRGAAMRDDGTNLRLEPMPYCRHQACLRAFAMTRRMCLSAADARYSPTYSSRRTCLSVADRLQLPGERRSELGDWRDVAQTGEASGQKWPAKEPMSARYSAV